MFLSYFCHIFIFIVIYTYTYIVIHTHARTHTRTHTHTHSHIMLDLYDRHIPGVCVCARARFFLLVLIEDKFYR
jgi:hypothetical protein